MRIALGCDHAGFNLKEKIKTHLKQKNHDITDCGAFSDERSDYPDFAKDVAKLVFGTEVEFGVLVCGSGMGMCMVANRFAHVRACVLHDENEALLARKHNDANVACFGSRAMDDKKVISLLDIFLATPFEGGRHEARVKKIDGE